MRHFKIIPSFPYLPDRSGSPRNSHKTFFLLPHPSHTFGTSSSCLISGQDILKNISTFFTFGKKDNPVKIPLDPLSMEWYLRMPVIGVGSFCIQGRRPYMEDRHQILYQPENPDVVLLAGVYDGHGGEMTSEYLKMHLIKKIDGKLGRPNDKMNLLRMSEIIRLLRNPEAERLAQSLSLPYHIPMGGESCTKFDQIVHSSLMSSFLEVDSEISKLSTCGSTAVVAVLYKQPSIGPGSPGPPSTAHDSPAKSTEGKAQLKLMVAGTGDSFALLGKFNGLPQQRRGGSPWESVVLYREHKPDDSSELFRIKKAGGFVSYTDCPRVCEILAMSRAFNDNQLKPFGLIADPDIFCFSLENLYQTPFIVIGSDGVLESFSHQQIIEFVADRYLEGKPASQTSYELVKAAAPRSRDNITAMVIYLNPPPLSLPPSKL